MVVNGWMRDEKHSQTSIHQHTSPMTICLSRWNASFLSFKEMASILAKTSKYKIKPAKILPLN